MMSKTEFDLDISKDYAPIIKVRLKSIKKYRDRDSIENIDEKFIVVNAMIDTGATNSLIDDSILHSSIEVRKTGIIQEVGFFNQPTEEVSVYNIGVDLSNSNNEDDPDTCIDTFVGLMKFNSRFDIMGTPIEMLIGRDILNGCIFTYNGLNKTAILKREI
jgi:hypothetical protein